MYRFYQALDQASNPLQAILIADPCGVPQESTLSSKRAELKTQNFALCQWAVSCDVSLTSRAQAVQLPRREVTWLNMCTAGR